MTLHAHQPDRAAPAADAAPPPIGPALRRFTAVTLTFLSAVGATYLWDGAVRVRPWVPGEAAPLATRWGIVRQVLAQRGPCGVIGASA